MRTLSLLLVAVALTSAPAHAQTMLAGEPYLAYWEVGDTASDRVIVVVHGGAGVPHNYLRPEWDALGQLGRVVFYDQRGCGRSPWPGATGWQEHVADLRRLIEAVSPGRPVVLAGSSWGSSLAAIYATQHPQDVEALVLSGIAGDYPLPRRESVRFLPELELPAGLEVFEQPEPFRFRRSLGGTRPNPYRAAEERARMGEVLAPRFTEDCPDTRMATWESMRTVPPPSVYPLSGLPVPVLAIVDNRFGIPFEVSASSPEVDGNVTTVVGGGHDPWFEHQGAFFALVSDFIRQVWAR